MCADYNDLNKACPKDCYPIPRIYSLLDSALGYEFLSFLDAFLRYHRIRINSLDQIHAPFPFARAINCYSVLLFCLKNALATYQCLINRMLKDQIGWNLEAYIDDMVIKTKHGNSSQRFDGNIWYLKQVKSKSWIQQRVILESSQENLLDSWW